MDQTASRPKRQAVEGRLERRVRRLSRHCTGYKNSDASWAWVEFIWLRNR